MELGILRTFVVNSIESYPLHAIARCLRLSYMSSSKGRENIPVPFGAYFLFYLKFSFVFLALYMGKIPLAFSSIMFIRECCQNVGACAEQIQRTAPRNSFWDGKMEPLQLFIINPVLHHPVDGELSFVTYVHMRCM